MKNCRLLYGVRLLVLYREVIVTHLWVAYCSSFGSLAQRRNIVTQASDAISAPPPPVFSPFSILVGTLKRLHVCSPFILFQFAL